jgi:hypothetical protein
MQCMQVLFFVLSPSSSIYKIKIRKKISKQKGFGIGAMIILNIIKPFIKFNSNTSLDSNATNMTNLTSLSPDDITLQIPYSIAGSFGFLMVIGFLIAQYFEMKTRKNVDKLPKDEELQEQSMALKKKEILNEEQTNAPLVFLQKILFKNKIFKTSADFCIVLTLIFYLFFLFLSINGFVSVLNTYMLTYFIKGPAKFALDQFQILQTLYWIFFVLGRFLAALIAFKLNSLVYFFSLLLINFVVFLLYVIPYFNSMQGFYWFFVCASGLSSGPLIPSCMMVANYVLNDLNGFLVSIFCISMGSGGLLSLYLTSVFLDKFNPGTNWFFYDNPHSSFVIPLILFFFVSLCFLIFLIIIGLYKKFKSILKN